MSLPRQPLTQTSAQTLVPRHLEDLVRAIKILVVDDDQHMRKVVRTMLSAIGVREIQEAQDGLDGLKAICAIKPDVVILDWAMPEFGGADFVRAVRSPGAFPYPNVPIVVLTGHGERSCVVDAMQLGANEYLLKPVSIKALFDRIVSVLLKPRPMMRSGDYYGPVPRKGIAGINEAEAAAIYADVMGRTTPGRAEPEEQRKDKGDQDPKDDIKDEIVLI